MFGILEEGARYEALKSISFDINWTEGGSPEFRLFPLKQLNNGTAEEAVYLQRSLYGLSVSVSRFL